MVDRVFKFGCRKPNDERLALQVLGQAWLYREDLRRVYNAKKRVEREEREMCPDAETEEVAHVQAFIRAGCEKRKNEAVQGIREKRGHLLDAGTYWLLEKDMLKADKASGFDPIKKQPWEGTGRIGACIQAREQFSADSWTHSRVQLSMPDERGYAVLTIRVGEARKKSPVRTISWPIKLHRAFPVDAIVKQVAVQRIRVGHRFRWEALITLSYNLGERDLGASGVVAIDVGWRNDGERGMRVATWSASDGSRGELHIDTLEAFEYADAVRSIRDRNFDAAKAYVRGAKLEGAEYAHLWKDKSRMVRLSEKSGDLGSVWWRERDKHLEDIECGVRTRAMRRRLDQYRVLADQLARKYRVVALEDMPMSDWVGQGDTHAKERKRSTAALYILQQAFAHRFGEGRVDWVPPEYTSMTCSACGAVRDEQVGPASYWACACGATHHQDENAADIIRARCERWIGDENKPRARSRKQKNQKRKKEADATAVTDGVTAVVTPRKTVGKAA